MLEMMIIVAIFARPGYFPSIGPFSCVQLPPTAPSTSILCTHQKRTGMVLLAGRLGSRPKWLSGCAKDHEYSTSYDALPHTGCCLRLGILLFELYTPGLHWSPEETWFVLFASWHTARSLDCLIWSPWTSLWRGGLVRIYPWLCRLQLEAEASRLS